MKYQVSKEEIDQMTKNRIWSISITSGGITAAVYYWLSQLPTWQAVEVLAKLKAYFGY